MEMLMFAVTRSMAAMSAIMMAHKMVSRRVMTAPAGRDNPSGWPMVGGTGMQDKRCRGEWKAVWRLGSFCSSATKNRAGEGQTQKFGFVSSSGSVGASGDGE